MHKISAYESLAYNRSYSFLRCFLRFIFHAVDVIHLRICMPLGDWAISGLFGVQASRRTLDECRENRIRTEGTHRVRTHAVLLLTQSNAICLYVILTFLAVDSGNLVRSWSKLHRKTSRQLYRAYTGRGDNTRLISTLLDYDNSSLFIECSAVLCFMFYQCFLYIILSN